MKVDAHQHFWQFEPEMDSWITDEMASIRRDFMPQDLQPVLQANGIDKCVAVQADQSLKQNDFLLGLAAQHDFIAGVVGWVDLQANDIDEQLQQYTSNNKMKGFRHVLQGEPNRALMLEDNFKRGINCLSKYNFTYDILIFTDQLQHARVLAAAFTNQLFVVDHIAKPQIKLGEIDEWKREIQHLAKLDNVYCKVSGMVTEADWHHWQYDDFVPYLDVIFEAFGTNRLMYGSDWPVCNIAGGYAKAKLILEKYTHSLSADEQANFWGLNAMQFYKL